MSLTVADVNGDGVPDVVVANGCASPSGCGTGTVSVLLGLGNGTLGSPVTYSSGSDNATSVAVADVNGDGKPDIVTSTSTNCNANPCNVGTVGILLGNGDGTFQAAITYPSGGILPLSVAVADVDGDGIPDVVVANACFLVDLNGRCYAQGSLGVLLGKGDGSFKPVVTYPAGPGQLSMNVGQLFTNSVVVADVNGDGKPDIVASSFCIGVESQCDSGDGYAAVLLALTTSKLPVGSHRVIATYSGDANFPPSTSSALIQTVQGAIAVLSTTSLNFGNQTVGMTSAAQTGTLKNTGNIDLALDITLAGTNPFNFVQTNNCGSSLSPNAICTISLKFKPLSAGARKAALSISDNAPNSPQKVWLSGVGVQP